MLKQYEEELRQAYTEVINEYDPYSDPSEAETPEEMLYNLREIREDIKNSDEEEMVYLYWHIDAVIEQFKAAGVGRVDA